MTPTFRVYTLLAIGGMVAAALNGLVPEQASMATTVWPMLLFDGSVLLLMLVDGLLVSSNRRPTLQREPLQRLSIGRDNAVTLTIQAKGIPADLHIYDQYPAALNQVPMPLRALCPAKTAQTLTYTVPPQQRGEFTWGDLQVRQRGAMGLAWRGWTV
ncbi:MAG: DUF58 domain-containing protein, partial [Cyanobacteria bacterium P01_A01_bin.105]